MVKIDYAIFTIPGPFSGLNTLKPVTDGSGNVTTEITGDPSANIFIIGFENDQVSNNFNIIVSFIFYVKVAYKEYIFFERTGQALPLCEPSNVSLVQFSGPNSKS